MISSGYSTAAVSTAGRSPAPASGIPLAFLQRQPGRSIRPVPTHLRLRTLKDLGWDNYVLDAKEWKSGVVPTPSQHNGFYVEKTALNAAFAQDGRHLHSVTFRVVGDADRFMHVLAEYGLCTRRQGSTSACTPSRLNRRNTTTDTVQIFANGAAPLTTRTLSTNLGDNLCASSVKIFTSK
ncbi:Uncharacterised protein [Serratia liquefaciens]|nr:Uncharacterised protein [Serratia liquefaciens]